MFVYHFVDPNMGIVTFLKKKKQQNKGLIILE